MTTNNSTDDVKLNPNQKMLKEDEDLRILTYKVILEKFNSKYSTLSKNQRSLLRNYINNISNTNSLKELIQQPIPNLTFKFSDIDDLKKLQQISLTEGSSEIKILLDKNNKIYTFLLKNKRKLDNRLLNTLDLLKYVVID